MPIYTAMSKPHRPANILVFDSGVGGLSIAGEIQQACPSVKIVYLSDNAGFPYGIKPDEFVISRSVHLIRELIEHHEPDIDVVVIACNTASTLALPALREILKVPVVGVVPAIKPAAQITKSHYIGVLATPATINRPYTAQLINEFASTCHVVSVGSSELVLLAEQKLRGLPISVDALKQALQPFLMKSDKNPSPKKLDQLVLACTHFPLLGNDIAQVLGSNVSLIDSGAAIARRVTHLVNSLGWDTSNNANFNQSDLLGKFWYTVDQTAQLSTETIDYISSLRLPASMFNERCALTALVTSD